MSQRSRHVEDALAGAERRVHAVPELVGERRRMSRRRGRVVEQHVGMHRRNRVGAERAAALVRAHGGVDPRALRRSG